MRTVNTAPGLLITGAVIFLVGAAIGVPQVFTEADPDRRLLLLTRHLGAWRAAQPLYALGPIITSVAVGYLAAYESSVRTRCLFAASVTALSAGAIAWSWSVYLRTVRIHDFALRGLPGWPFATYVLLTIGGLALLGAGLVAGRQPDWLGWSVLAAAGMFLTVYLAAKDIPPFLFYILLLIVGVVTV